MAGRPGLSLLLCKVGTGLRSWWAGSAPVSTAGSAAGQVRSPSCPTARDPLSRRREAGAGGTGLLSSPSPSRPLVLSPSPSGLWPSCPPPLPLLPLRTDLGSPSLRLGPPPGPAAGHGPWAGSQGRATAAPSWAQEPGLVCDLTTRRPEPHPWPAVRSNEVTFLRRQFGVLGSCPCPFTSCRAQRRWPLGGGSPQLPGHHGPGACSLCGVRLRCRSIWLASGLLPVLVTPQCHHLTPGTTVASAVSPTRPPPCLSSPLEPRKRPEAEAACRRLISG